MLFILFLFSFLKTIVDGITKSVKFDENGRRSEIEVQISELNTQGVVPVATWNIESGIKTIAENVPSAPEDSSLVSLKNRTFIVLTSLVNINISLKKLTICLIYMQSIFICSHLHMEC